MRCLKHTPILAALAVFAMAHGAAAQDYTYRDFDNSADSTKGEPQDRYQDQEREFNQAVKRGTDALKKGDYPAANTHFAKALELDPKNPGVCYLMALTKVGLGKSGDAVSYLDTAVASDASYVEARVLLAKLLLRGGDKAGAREQLDALKAMQGACAGRCSASELEGAIAQLESMLA